MEAVNPVDIMIRPEGLFFVLGQEQSRLVCFGTTQEQPVVLDLRRADRTTEMIVPSRCGYCYVAGAAARVSHSDLKSPVIRPRGAGI